MTEDKLTQLKSVSVANRADELIFVKLSDVSVVRIKYARPPSQEIAQVILKMRSGDEVVCSGIEARSLADWVLRNSNQLKVPDDIRSMNG